MKHRFDKSFFEAQTATADKAKAEAKAEAKKHNGKTWKRLKNDEKDKFAFLTSQMAGVLPKDIAYE